ncbi:LuxR C-terminal-related transcriptional regulator [Phosphitispora fastidiosa]|uniref:LuxR C-terminal-related transcriptional regulator n=1 Tax=Phosphitispora fastidiosa TaxID=2837202 RepID=UPI001E60BEDC|nr:LuxR C-terminal-related transcriptional regulator [Phosphitispora fastidiosa]MBU7006567.1 DNA-binding CsgD family transcriptional regulator [Phosphitispora fastidiosa]
MANDRGQRSALYIKKMNERSLSIVFHSLFSSWMLAFLFEGQILYSLTNAFKIDPVGMVFCGVAAIFAGLLLCGLFIKTKRAAKRLFLCSYLFFILVSVAFFFPPSIFWTAGIIAGSFLAGGCVAAWAFYLKSGTPKNERIKTVADLLILSNVLMILLNMTAIHISPHVGLAFSMIMLLGAFAFALKLPVDHDAASSAASEQKESPMSIAKLLVFLCLFIVIITINSGLMYQVINPAFAHLEVLTSWYWAIPYIAALFVMRNLPRRINRAYILYVAIAMIGISFIGFVSLDRSTVSYLVVNTLMLGAFGVYDLFWWSILGEMLDFHKNPAKILGIGLSANVLGVLLGGLIGNAVTSVNIHSLNPTLLALAVVCVTLTLLPPLHKQLSFLLKDHAYLSVFSEMSAQEQTNQVDSAARFGNLSERESQVASLLLQGKTYRTIAGELFISENTVKYYVKNIYSKFGIKSRAELIDIVLKKEDTAPLQ